MAVPHTVNDGSFLVEHQIGADEWSTPFSLFGDSKSFEVKRKYRVQQDKYVRMKAMTKIQVRKGTAYLVEEGDANDIGNGLLEFQRTFAAVPNRRVEGTSIVYNLQFLSISTSYDWESPPEEPTVTSISRVMSAEVVYEYFLRRPLPQDGARVEVLFGTPFYFGGWGQFTPGQRVLAEDSTVEIYKAGIYVRRSVYIRWPNVTT